MTIHIDQVLASVEFKPGHWYSDYVADVDNVEAWWEVRWWIRRGFDAMLKFWKVIGMGLLGVVGA